MTKKALLFFFLFFFFFFLFSLECVSGFWVGYSWNRRPERPVGGTPLLGSAQDRVPFSGLRYMKPWEFTRTRERVWKSVISVCEKAEIKGLTDGFYDCEKSRKHSVAL